MFSTEWQKIQLAIMEEKKKLFDEAMEETTQGSKFYKEGIAAGLDSALKIIAKVRHETTNNP